MRLLIIRFSSIGDIILTTPVLAAIKARYPAATLDFIVTDTFADAVRGNPHINHLILFDKKRYRGIAGITRFARRLRPNGYDRIIDLHAKLRSLILSHTIGAPVSRYRKRSVRKTLGVSLRLMRYQVDDTIVNNYFGALQDLKIPPGPEKLRFDYTPQDAAAVADYRDFIILAPGAARNTKKWPPANFARLGLLLEEKIVIVGGPEDFEDGEAIRRQIGSNCRNLAGRLTLKQSGALIARAKYIVCNDSAPFHMARGVGTQAFVFFGPTDPGMFNYDDRAQLIYAGLTCSPCSLHGDRKCPLGHFNCMLALTPEKVREMILTTA